MTNKLKYREYGTGEPLYFLHVLALDKKVWGTHMSRILIINFV